jgi:hypothetical protein
VAEEMGFGPNPEREWVEFEVLIPLDSKELEVEGRRYLAKLEASMTPEQKAQFTRLPQNNALENTRQLLRQNRAGHFQLNCRILDVPAYWVPPASNLKCCLRVVFQTSVCPALPPFNVDVADSKKMTKSLQVPIFGKSETSVPGPTWTISAFYRFRPQFFENKVAHLSSLLTIDAV